jgi:hypothetical protein
MIGRVTPSPAIKIAEGRNINIRAQCSLHSLDPVGCTSLSRNSNSIAAGSRPITAAAMATLSSDGLQTLLAEVGVESPVPPFPLADIQNSPMGIYLSYLAEILVQLTECVPQVAYGSIQWPNDLGDLVVVLPRLRLKDVKPNDLAVELKKRVGWHALFLLRSISVCQSNVYLGN